MAQDAIWVEITIQMKRTTQKESLIQVDVDLGE
jgi:hypothetical protein